MAIFEFDLSQLKLECVCLANAFRLLRGGGGGSGGGSQVKKKRKENKTTTTKENYIFKMRMKDVATSKVNSVTELQHCVIDFASRTTAA